MSESNGQVWWHDDGSFERHASRKEGAVSKYLGVCTAKVSDVLFSSNQNLTFFMSVMEGWDNNRSPIALDERIREFRGYGDKRKAIVGVQGRLPFCMDYFQNLQEPDFVIFCAPKADLEELGVEIIDKDWQPGDQLLSIDHWLFGGVAASVGETDSGEASRQTQGESGQRTPESSPASTPTTVSPMGRVSSAVQKTVPWVPPKTVQRSSDASYIPQVDIAEGSAGFVPDAEGIPVTARALIDQVLAGQDPEADGDLVWREGVPVEEKESGVRGTLARIQPDGMLVVKFEDEEDASLVAKEEVRLI